MLSLVSNDVAGEGVLVEGLTHAGHHHHPLHEVVATRQALNDVGDVGHHRVFDARHPHLSQDPSISVAVVRRRLLLTHPKVCHLLLQLTDVQVVRRLVREQVSSTRLLAQLDLVLGRNRHGAIGKALQPGDLQVRALHHFVEESDVVCRRQHASCLQPPSTARLTPVDVTVDLDHPSLLRAFTAADSCTAVDLLVDATFVSHRSRRSRSGRVFCRPLRTDARFDDPQREGRPVLASLMASPRISQSSLQNVRYARFYYGVNHGD
ncbi:unnamed protein product [Closterium sp. NIES-53]